MIETSSILLFYATLFQKISSYILYSKTKNAEFIPYFISVYLKCQAKNTKYSEIYFVLFNKVLFYPKTLSRPLMEKNRPMLKYVV